MKDAFKFFFISLRQTCRLRLLSCGLLLQRAILFFPFTCLVAFGKWEFGALFSAVFESSVEGLFHTTGVAVVANVVSTRTLTIFEVTIKVVMALVEGSVELVVESVLIVDKVVFVVSFAIVTQEGVEVVVEVILVHLVVSVPSGFLLGVA